MSKNVKKVESVVQVFTFLHFEIANWHFHCIIITHVMLYIQHYIKTIHFSLKYTGLAIVRKTTKLIERGHRGLQDYTHICYYFYVFYVFFAFFQNPKSRDFLHFFAGFRTFSRTMLMYNHFRSHHLSIPRPFTPDLKLISFTNPFPIVFLIPSALPTRILDLYWTRH